METTDLHFNNCRLEVLLEPQSPMIHFQAKQTGATIRASEVKPKLDRYILDNLMKKENMTLEELKSSEEYKCIFQDTKTGSDNHALKYKMQITCEEPPTQIIVNHSIKNYNKSFHIFYGNSGRDPEDKYFGIISQPKITLLCFQPKVCSLITEYVRSFFLTTNFGMMQGKGFGSFAPAGYRQALTESNKAEIARYLKEKMNARYCFAMSFDVPKRSETQVRYWDHIFDEIKVFYSIMKSGQNYPYLKAYIYQYMMNKGIRNEKAEIKQKGVAPILCKPENDKKNRVSHVDEKPRYVRAFLGTANQVTYGSKYKADRQKNNNVYELDNKEKVTVEIESVQEDDQKKAITKAERIRKDNRKIERFSSPIFFKIIKNTVFIVAGEIPEEMYGANFKFSSRLKSEPLYIPVPSKEDLGNQEFDTSAFLKEYVDYYNGLKEKNKIRNNKRQECRKVAEVK